MSNLDQFESAFRAAAKTAYEHQPIRFTDVLVVTDLDEQAADAFAAGVQAFLAHAGPADDLRLRTLSTEDYDNVAALLDRVVEFSPSLICTYRHLKSDAWKWPYSLGEYLDVLTQVATSPVMVLPHPKAGRAAEHAMSELEHVMAMTDHLAGDHRLVNFAAALTQRGGSLYLAHIEDDATFERYIEAISRIAEIDTDVAREKIRERLLKDPVDYIASCKRGLADAGADIEAVAIVTAGHHLAEYKRLVDEHHIDLLVMNTRDDDQMAMHGLAYPLAVEMRSIPLLLL